MATTCESTAACELIVDVVKRFGQARLKVLGLSMVPAVWPGDVLHIRRCDSDIPSAGQVILYKRGNELVAHRFVAAFGHSLIVKGDAVPCADSPISRSDVIGIGTSVIRADTEASLTQTSSQRVAAFLASRSVIFLRILLYWNRRMARPVESAAACSH